MKDESWTLSGWPAVPAILMLAVTPVLTTLVISLLITWLVNHVFAANAIHTIFGVEHIGYWRVVIGTSFISIMISAIFRELEGGN